MEAPERFNGDAISAHALTEVHQAEGMVMAQLGVDIHAASERLHAFAVAAHRPVIDVARDIVAHRLRLSPSPDPE